MDKRTLAKNVSEELLIDCETSGNSISNILLKAKRLALLISDQDAQTWLDLELRGYPNGFIFETLGNVKKYAIQGGRIDINTNKYWLPSLPEIEALMCSSDKILSCLHFPTGISPSLSSSNQYEHIGLSLNNAVGNLLKNYNQLVLNHRTKLVNNSKLYYSIKASIHNYITDVFITLSYGDITKDIFEQARDKVDIFIRSTCPKAIEQLLAINDAMQKDEIESFSQALVTCRRILQTVADAIFPPQKEDYTDRKGKNRKVGNEEYKNRLLAYIDKNVNESKNIEIQISEIEHIALKLDAVYDNSCKGVHSDINKDDAILTVIYTYLFISEISNIYSNINKESSSSTAVATAIDENTLLKDEE